MNFQLLMQMCCLLIINIILQFTSGADLSILMVDVLNKSETLPSQQYFDKITNLFGSMSPGSPERETFCQDALKWSIKGTDFKTGHPDLHKRIAQVFWRGN